MQDVRFAKFVLFVNGAVPLSILGWDALHHQLGADAPSHAIHITGILALVFLSLSLLVTPIRKITGWNWLIFSRRTFGLYAFFYACLHLFLYYSLQKSYSLSATFSEIIHRWYLLVGFSAILCMAPLAATSFNVMIKKLGPTRWRALHRLAYVAAILGVIHYYEQAKADKRLPLVFMAILAAALAYRLIAFLLRPAPKPAPAGKPKLWSGPLRVTHIIEETPDVRTFRLASTDGQRLPFRHQPGQYLLISQTIDGKKVNRTYTIASSPTQSDSVELTVKREALGLFSRHLHNNLRVGDTVTISAPAGRFTFMDEKSPSTLLIAGGVGITPVMAMLRYLTFNRWPGDIYFIYSAKTSKDIIFRHELADLQRRFSNLHLHITLTRADSDWSGPTGRITAELLTRLVPHISAQSAYICGPTSMMDPTIQLLRTLGIPQNRIHSEAFLPAKRSMPTSALAPTNGHQTAAPITPTTSSRRRLYLDDGRWRLRRPHAHLLPFHQNGPHPPRKKSPRNSRRSRRPHRLRMPLRHLRPLQDAAAGGSSHNGCGGCARRRG